MLFMPPRHGKSRISSICWPAWHLGHHPEHSFILGSYGMDLSCTFSRQARSAMREDWYGETFATAALSDDDAAAAYWKTTKGGSYKAVGVGSAVTGQGCNILVLDDTVKDRAGAYSSLKRQRAWEWYCWDVSSRLAPGGGVVVIQTLWHHDGLPMRILKRDGIKSEGGLWDVIKFPAIATQDEYHQGQLVRSKGEALHPERYPEDCEVFRAAQLYPTLWSALYQQSPTLEEGAIFKRAWFEHRWTDTNIPRGWDSVTLSIDSKFKETTSGSYVVIQAWGRSGNAVYLLDQLRGRWGLVDTIARIQAMGDRYDAAKILVEDKGNGSSIIEVMRRESGHGHKIEAINPGSNSKEARAHAATPYCEAGQVWLPARATWLPDFEAELFGFPAAAHDDQVDALDQYLGYEFVHAGIDYAAWLS
jgi:predicted phage terminase large subunit-like protein